MELGETGLRLPYYKLSALKQIPAVQYLHQDCISQLAATNKKHGMKGVQTLPMLGAIA